MKFQELRENVVQTPRQQSAMKAVSLARNIVIRVLDNFIDEKEKQSEQDLSSEVLNKIHADIKLANQVKEDLKIDMMYYHISIKKNYRNWKNLPTSSTLQLIEKLLLYNPALATELGSALEGLAQSHVYLMNANDEVKKK